MRLLKAVVVAILAVLLTAILLMGVMVLVIFIESRGAGATGIGAVGLPVRLDLITLLLMLVFAVGFVWQYRKSVRAIR